MSEERKRKCVLVTCCTAHAVQDGLGAALYVILPIIAPIFNLSLTQIGVLRSLNSAAMASFEILSGILSERFGERNLLTFGLISASFGYIGLAFTNSYWMIGACFFVIGFGGAFQHALSSSLVSRAYNSDDRRTALGIYNSLGDTGKLIFTSIFSLAIGVGLTWQPVVSFFGSVALFAGVGIFVSLMYVSTGAKVFINNDRKSKKINLGWGLKNKATFFALCVTVFLDTGIQAAFLTFVAFFITSKGASLSAATIAISIVLVGGIAGKAICGFLADLIGIRPAFIFVQFLTAFGILLLLVLDIVFIFILLPFLGMVLQGSTSITYSLVSDLVHTDRLSRGFSIIYSVSSLSGFLGPILFGLTSDNYGLNGGMYMLAGISLLSILPLFHFNQKANSI